MSHATEKYETCPYNQAHTILVYRMQVHLHKCRKSYPTTDFGTCAHNSTHHIPRPELKWHEDHECPNRHNFQAMIANFEDSAPRIPIDHIELPESEENWDDDIVNHFDPEENARSKCLIRGRHCVPPSERKNFRAEHRRHVESNEEIATKVKLAAQPRKPPAPKEDAPMQPLRAPMQLPRGFNMGRGMRQPNNEASAAAAASSSPSSPPSPSISPLVTENDGQEIKEVCPYDKNHEILPGKMANHLHYCQKNFPNSKMSTCAYNSTHRIPHAQLKRHEDGCSNRPKSQDQNSSPANSAQLVPIDNICLPESEENWDDGPINIFDPRENAKAKSLIRGIHCEPRSVRKLFQSEHKKHVQNNDRIETKANLNAHNRQPVKSTATKLTK